MAFQQIQSSVLVFTVCLVLVITSAGNFKVRAAAQQYEAMTLEGGCPTTQDHFEGLRSKLLQDIELQIEQLSDIATQSMTTTDEDTQSTESPTTEQTTEESMPTTADPLYTCNGTPGWRQVVFINMTDTSYNCPPGLNLTSYSKRTCGRAHANINDCSSTAFSVGGSQYSQVCGQMRGYQVGATSAFYGYIDFSQTIDGSYVDGVSLTYGLTGRRQHIWTFAIGAAEIESGTIPELCPCVISDSRVVSPPFVGNDYFCESGINSRWSGQVGVAFLDDPLWDGQNCTSTNTCCQFNNPPWFTKTLPNPTTDDIELRLCLVYQAGSDDALLELIELYVQ